MSSPIVDRLAKEGWEKQFIASGKKLRAALEDYRALGYAVKTVSARELDCDDCRVCFEDENDDSAMIFTKKTGASELDDLYDDKDG